MAINVRFVERQPGSISTGLGSGPADAYPSTAWHLLNGERRGEIVLVINFKTLRAVCEENETEDRAVTAANTYI